MFTFPLFIKTFENLFSAQFNGVDESINLGDMADLERTAPFSVSCWIKTSSSGVHTILSRMETAVSKGWLFFIQSGELKMSLRNTTNTNEIRVNTTSTFHNNNWHHVVITYDGSSAASGVTIYADDTSQSLTTTHDNLTASILNSGACSIGSRNNTDLYFNGFIDEPVIYDKELSAAEVTSIYNAGKPNRLSSLPSAADFLGWWRFTQEDKNNFPTIKDHSNNGENGTAVNMTSGDIQGDVP